MATARYNGLNKNYNKIMAKKESNTTKMARALGKRGGDRIKEIKGLEYFKEIGKAGGEKRWKKDIVKKK